MTKPNAYTYLSQSDIALQIERLVQAIEDSDSPAYRIKQARTGYDRVEETKLSRYFPHIRQMVDLFEGGIEYSYSEHLQAFREACQVIGLERNPDGPVCLNEEGTAWLDHHRSMNVLVARIRQLAGERWYLRRKDDLRHQARKQEIRACDYADTLCERYSRITIVRVNLYYRSAAQARLRVEHVFDDLEQLIAEHRRNSLFDHLIGHIYSVEQGDRNDGRGYHIHAAYFFNGNEVRGDVYKAIQLGELWEDITHGQGYMDSCNHDKERYGDECGIGRLERNDRAIRRHLHKAVKYLVKDAQHLRLRPEGARCLRTGHLKRRHRG
ncbi:inovirus-type Gp2 protein [Pseudomonas lundensis]|uniref:inovirus-type Gp2 protein n=1 Tax=Pseudomonas lundensis TaxID=86185 RepID=UPI0014747E2C|nr:inovirus-type Gp2 protein [Pseudomonas lundensis]NNA21189.1 inovirus-type Gp2 protein [Pseudomonas lundensis]